MRFPLALVVAVVALAVPAGARANDAMLWACHGPDGGGLPARYDTLHSAGAFVTPSSPVPCAAAGDTIRVGFSNPSPPEGSFAALRLNAPAGVQVQGVWLGRRVTGPGYFARTSTTALDALDAGGTLDGVFAHAATGAWVDLGVRCATAGCDMSGAGLDFRFAALSVHDAAAPAFTVGALPAYAAGVTDVIVDARDTGIGLATVSATLAGVPAAANGFGGSLCRELSPADATADLPLAEDCPATRRLALALDTRLVADGTQPLEIAVTDGSGNASVQRVDLKVVNHPPVAVTPSPTPVRTPVATVTPTPVPSTAALGGVGRYRGGAIDVEASCPAGAAASCPVSLTLRAKLPPSRRTTTIARGHSSVKPGAKAKVKLKLSAAARHALAKRRTLRATLTLAGAPPLSVKLAR